MKNYYEDIKNIVKELSDLLFKVDQKEIDNYINELLNAESIFFVGTGRVELSLAAAVKRFTHLGLDCHMVGDLNEPPITKNDLLIVGSGSGESLFPLGVTSKAKSYGAKVVHLTSSPYSTIAKQADLIITFESPSKVNTALTSLQPMSTVFEQGLFLFHDILTLQIMRKKGLTFADLEARHANLE